MSSVENQITDLNDAEIAQVDGGALLGGAVIVAGVIFIGGVAVGLAQSYQDNN